MLLPFFLQFGLSFKFISQMGRKMVLSIFAISEERDVVFAMKQSVFVSIRKQSEVISPFNLAHFRSLIFFNPKNADNVSHANSSI